MMNHVVAGVRERLSAVPRPVGPLVAAASVGMVMAARGQGLDPFTFLLTMLLVWAAVSLRGSSLLGLMRRRPAPGLHDEVDHETGVGNARAALALLEREMSRAGTHGSLFSVVVLDIGREILADVHPRRSVRVLTDLLRGIANDVRAGDRVCRVATSDRELVVVVLPDTGASGARLFTNRLVSHVQRRLVAEGGVLTDQGLRTELVTAPDDHDAVERLLRRLQVLVGTEELILGADARSRRAGRVDRSERTRVGAGARGEGDGG